MREIESLDREELLGLLGNAAKLWLAHDGLWFQEVEKKFGLETAVQLNENAMSRWTVLEAKRIMEWLGLTPGGGLDALDQALRLRLYIHLNDQEIERVDEKTLVFRMKSCRVQVARSRKNLPEHPCKGTGVLEYSGFAETIDPRIRTSCLYCPPDQHPENSWCAWRFEID